MKIWEIEEGREFIEISWRARYKKENGKLYYLHRDSKEWVESTLLYNAASTSNFEYLPEKKYYLKAKEELKCGEDNYLNYYKYEDVYTMANEYELDRVKTQFTEKEIAELIPPLWLTVCDRIEVEE